MSMTKTAKQCWICFGEEGFVYDNEEERWLNPCRCKGSTGWVHEACLLEWVNSRLSSPSSTHPDLQAEAVGPLVTPSIACPQCHYVYRIRESYLLPRPILLAFKETLKWKDRLLLFSSVGLVSTGVYLLAFSYGAATFFVTTGPAVAIPFFQRHSMPLINLARTAMYGQATGPVLLLPVLQSWLKLIVGMPLIPICILTDRFRLMNSFISFLMPAVLYDGASFSALQWPPMPNLTALLLPIALNGYRSLRSSIFRFLPLNQTCPSPPLFAMDATDNFEGNDDDEDDGQMNILAGDNRVALKITENSLSSLLLLPTTSALFGWVLFRKSSMHGFHRTCLGGAIVLVLSDLAHALYRYQADYLRRSRRILNYQKSLDL